MITITCPKCNAESRFSLMDRSFEGPFKCYKCHSFMKLKVIGETIMSNELITDEESQKLQDMKAMKDKLTKKGEDEYRF